jgi:ABC-type transport system involved in multi-copper enzyme maturation permease subunit
MSYPLKRRDILSAKLLSALGVALFLFLGIQMFALFILAPEILRDYFNIILLSYLANFSTVILVGMLVFLLALVLKRGGLAFVAGVIVYFAFGIFGEMVTFVSWAGSDAALRVYGLVAPNMILDRYYIGTGSLSWVPSFSEVLIYLGVSYFAIILVFLLGYVYFDRRFGI